MEPVRYIVEFYGDALSYFDKINAASLERAWGLFAEHGDLITAILALFVALYFLWGALGLSSVSLQDMAINACKVALAYALIMSWALFYDNIGQFILETPKELGGAISSAMGGGAAGDDLAQQVASMAEKVYNFTMKMFEAHENGLWPNVTGALIVFVVLVFGLLPMLLILTGVTLYAKMITAIMLAIGPIAILCYFFGITRGIFEAWVKGLTYGIFMLLFTYIMAGLAFGFLVGMMDTINDNMATQEGSLAIATAMVLYLAIIAFFILQVPGFAQTFAFGHLGIRPPGGGGVGEAYSRARVNLSQRGGRGAAAAGTALALSGGPVTGGAAATGLAARGAAAAGRGAYAGAGSLGRMLTNRRRNG